MDKPIKMVSAVNFFKCLTADTTVYLGFVEVIMGQLKFKHHGAHGNKFQEAEMGDAHSEGLLDDI